MTSDLSSGLSAPNRRGFLAGAAVVLALPGCATIDRLSGKGKAMFYVGTYNTGEIKGIYPLTYSSYVDTWTLGVPISSIANASFGTWNEKAGRYYMLDEQTEGRVGVYDRHWKPIGDVSSQGKDPCYVSIDPTGAYVAVANYSSGNVVIYKTGANGALIEPPVIRQNSGTGPNSDRQEGPHAHWVQFHGDHIYSVDLGTDQVLGYSFDSATGAVGEAFTAYQAPAGSGPRHMVFHPDGQHAFVTTELSSQVIALRKTADGRFEAIQTLSTLPAGFTGKSYCAHIVLNKAADRLYISNRGDNSIAVFQVAADGTLTLLQVSPTLGDWPRFFLFQEDIKRVVVAHQNGNSLVVFEIKADGTLAPKNQTVAVPKPVFIGAIA